MGLGVVLGEFGLSCWVYGCVVGLFVFVLIGVFVGGVCVEDEREGAN